MVVLMGLAAGHGGQGLYARVARRARPSDRQGRRLRLSRQRRAFLRRLTSEAAEAQVPCGRGVEARRGHGLDGDGEAPWHRRLRRQLAGPAPALLVTCTGCCAAARIAPRDARHTLLVLLLTM